MSVKQKRPDDLINILEADYQSRYEHGFAWASIVALFLDLPGLRAFWSAGDVDQYGKLIDSSGQGNTLTNNNTALVNTRPLPPYIEFTGTEYLTQATGAGGIALGAGTLDVATINDTSIPNHTHAITSSSSPGAAASILASSGAGALTLGGLFTASANINLSEYLYHDGDADTYLRYQADQITLRAGGVDMIDIVEAATDYVQFASKLVLNGASPRDVETTTGADANINLRFDFPDASSVNAGILLFRNTNTTGTRRMVMYRGDGSASIQHLLNAYGDSYVNALTGDFGVGTTVPLRLVDVTAVSSNNAQIQATAYSNTVTHSGIIALQKSTGTTKGTLAQTVNTDVLGNIYFRGVDTGGTAENSVGIRGVQVGAAGTRVSGEMQFWTVTNNASAITQKMTLTNVGNLLLGTITSPAGGGKVLVVGDNGGDPTPGANTAGFYGKDVAGTVEAYAVDEAGNAAQLTPHAFILFDPPPEAIYPWSYYCSNEQMKLEINVDMWSAIKDLEALTGKQYIYERRLP